MNVGSWPFDQPRNCATITMRQILDGHEPILLVGHDQDDHGWQFIGSTDANTEDGRVVCLEHMVALDPSLLEVADLPVGWQAVRDSDTSPWVRRKAPAEDWLFHDEPNTACLTSEHVHNGSPVLRVYHDYDGDWQFHGDSTQSADDEVAKLVCLADVVGRDASLAELHDLPYGWRAERTSTSQQWTRQKDHPFPTFADNGYYLEDAVWLSDYLPDINPPNADVREDLPVGQYVKLVFRFAAEDSDREENECERMWVLVAGQHDDGNYRGSIENDPHHDAAKYGDDLVFHPLHVAEVHDGQ